MERINRTSSVSEFILLGLSSRPEDQKPLFVLFLTVYLITITGNVLIILAIRTNPPLQTPMYFFLSFLSFTDICFTTAVVPKMLENFLSEKKIISYAGCLMQMYFLYALGNSDSCLLAVMAFDRYVAICDPFHYVTTMSHRRFLKIPSASGKRKAFSTCGSHLTVVTLFYGSIFYVYLQPLSTYSIKDHMATIVYTVLSSMLNPFIYSLRNKDLKQGLKKLMRRRS
ncbi:Olfactory receptor 1L8 [Tupaia chinensis]|uniref:Olfactory receptor 1L8 n=1 Tax=Tupaia chinensis TaxID=246437 RepID=L9KTY4_TUPCH|nr:Olfactory receptor 1L8 [Tupaia chinensis]